MTASSEASEGLAEAVEVAEAAEEEDESANCLCLGGTRPRAGSRGAQSREASAFCIRFVNLWSFLVHSEKRLRGSEQLVMV